MTGEQENDRCYFCGGKLEAKITLLPFVVSGNVIIVKNVPAAVCSQCGEAVMSSDVAKQLDHLLKQAQNTGFEMSVVAYPQSAMAMA
jgi:YgiT-type zinc finger domain-containing protein